MIFRKHLKFLFSVKVLMLACLIASSSCGGKKTILEEQVTKINKKQTTDNITFFFKNMTTMNVKVLYQEGAEPFTGKGQGGIETWGLTEKNIAEVFKVRDQEIELKVPSEIEEMTKIDDEKQESWASSEIVNLAQKHGHVDKVIEEATATFTMVFLDGNFADDEGTANPNVIAVSLNGTNVIAVFKPVISKMSNDNERLGRFIEQSTIIHELGHALGLVNNGVGLTSPHHDEEHGAHCTNEDCVMYWLNEGRDDLITFVQNVMTNNGVVLFGDECLQDFKSY